MLISALEYYREACEPLEGFYRYERELGALRRFLKRENCRFRNTCEKLLEPIVDTRSLPKLLNRPGGPEWKNPQVQANLERLLDHAYASFFETVEELNEDLSALVGRLDVDLDGKVSDPNCLAMLKGNNLAPP